MTTETTPAIDELTDHEHAILDFERSWWKHNGAKESAIRERFQLSPTSYYVQLNRLISRPLALAADPLLVRRLLRLREARRAHRSAGRLALEQR